MEAQNWKHLMFRVLGTVSPRIAAHQAYTLFTTPRPRPFSAARQAVIDSAQVLNSTYTNGSLVGYVWGEGPSILCVHGWEGGAHNFTSMVMPLVMAGYRVVAFDAPAHGRSDGKSSSIVEYAQVLAALITEFGPMYGVIAHSLGAAAMVYMMGTIKHYKIRRLVTIGAPSDMEAVMQRFADHLKLTPQTLQHMHSLLHKRIGVPVTAVSVKSMIPYIRTPGLVIHDRQDPVIPFSDAETIAAHWNSGTRLIATDGLGHNRILADSRVIQYIVQFMADSQIED